MSLRMRFIAAKTKSDLNVLFCDSVVYFANLYDGEVAAGAGLRIFGFMNLDQCPFFAGSFPIGR